MITIPSKMKHYQGMIDVSVALYDDGTTALVFTVPDTHEPLSKASVNMRGHTTSPHYDSFSRSHIFIKDYSENEGVEQTLLDAEVVELSDVVITLDHVTINGAIIINEQLRDDIESLHFNADFIAH